jgi:hypothetical protein
MKKLRSLLILAPIFSILMAVSVYAQAALVNAFKPIFNMLFGIVVLYDQMPYPIDFILYLIFFMGFWRFAFERVEAWKESINTNAVKSMYVVLGIISSIGVTLLEYRSNVNLSVLGPYFLFIFLVLLCLLAYNFFGRTILAVGAIGLIMAAMLGIVFASAFKGVANQEWYQIFYAICLAGGFVCTFIGVWRIFQGKDGNPLDGHAGEHGTGGGHGGHSEPQTPEEEAKSRRAERAVKAKVGEINSHLSTVKELIKATGGYGNQIVHNVKNGAYVQFSGTHPGTPAALAAIKAAHGGKLPIDKHVPPTIDCWGHYFYEIYSDLKSGIETNIASADQKIDELLEIEDLNKVKDTKEIDEAIDKLWDYILAWRNYLVDLRRWMISAQAVLRGPFPPNLASIPEPSSHMRKVERGRF